MNILGLSAHYHEAAACLLQDGRLVAAAAEERFSRVKHDPNLPVLAARDCLAAGGIGIDRLDCVAYYESPEKKADRQHWSGVTERLDPGRPEREIRTRLGYEGRIHFFEHHPSHAASAFYFSGFPEAAVLTVDGVGEWATTSYGVGRGDALELFEEVWFPHSLGLLYSTLTSYLGFGVNDGEYKVMGLAPYGQPRCVDAVRRLIRSGPRGQYTLEMEFFDYVRGRRMYSDALCTLFGAPPREPESEILSFHCDVARSLQVALEEILLEKASYLHARTGSENLCLAGGVALNCVANGRLLREGPFHRLFVQPAAGDDGGCLGAAAQAHVRLTGRRPLETCQEHACLGPAFDREPVARLLDACGVVGEDYVDRESQLLETVAERLERGETVGWFQGRMEFGPRALGSRSILADPRRPEMRERLNRMVKKREAFRPFAPSVLASHAAEHFDLDHPSPFMLETCQVRSPLCLPAITHVDGSVRPQTVDPALAPRFAGLIGAFFRRTGCPLLLNTSFNMRGEPIVCTPADALRCAARSGLDALILGDFLVDRLSLSTELREAVERWYPDSTPPAIRSTVYTFV